MAIIHKMFPCVCIPIQLFQTRLIETIITANNRIEPLCVLDNTQRKNIGMLRIIEAGNWSVNKIGLETIRMERDRSVLTINHMFDYMRASSAIRITEPPSTNSAAGNSCRITILTICTRPLRNRFLNNIFLFFFIFIVHFYDFINNFLLIGFFWRISLIKQNCFSFLIFLGLFNGFTHNM